MRDVDIALSQISSIRAQLAASTRFLGIAPGLNAVAAVLVLIVAVIQRLFPSALAQRNYVVVWGAVLTAITAVAVVEAIARARRLHGAMAQPMLQIALQKALPFYAAGCVIAWAICRFSPASTWLIPGVWQILIGVLGFSALSSLPRGMAWAAAWYFVCGSIVLGLAGASGVLSPWMMGVPCAAGQIMVAAILSRDCSGSKSDGEQYS